MAKPCESIMLALSDGDLSSVELSEVTGLTATEVDEALFRLKGQGRVRRLTGGAYRLVDTQHGASVKRGLFIKTIPTLAICAYVAPAFPVLEHLLRARLWAL